MEPDISASAYIAPSAVVTGDVHIGPDCGIWHGAVVRADEDAIYIGQRSNIQDNATVHVDTGFPVHIGSGVTVGHNAVVHGCSIGDNTLIGMGAIVLNGATIGRDCIIGAGALVTEGKTVADGEVWVGSPAKRMRETGQDGVAANERNANIYVELAREALAKAHGA